MIVVELPIRTVSENNYREHWAVRHRRRKQQRLAAEKGVSPALGSIPGQGDIKVRLVRISPKQLDGDNLQGALKAVRDGVSDAVGIDDGPNTRLKWFYGQEPGRHVGIRVEIKIAEVST